MRSPDRKKPCVKRRLDMQLELLEKRVMMNAASFLATPSIVYAPAQMRTAYGVNLVPGAGQGMTVAIVDAFSDPTVLSDVNTFSNSLGLPKMDGVGADPTLSIVTPPGQAAPAYNFGWAVEIGLDVEWVHAIAPYANIDLVECQNNSGDSLFAAEVDGQPYQSGEFYAQTGLPGVVAVSNSYGGGEFFGETAYDVEFNQNPNVVITVSTGDSGANGEYPAYSPNVLAIGGTSLYTISGRGRYGIEHGWSGSGGGISAGGELAPAFQTNNGVDFGARSTPDVSMDADPNTGALVYYSFDGLHGFYGVGGTSLACPMWAGIIALADQARAANSLAPLGTADAHNAFYGLYGAGVAYSGLYFHDVIGGSNPFPATAGYDLVTGIGSPIAQDIVTYLSTYGMGAAAILGGPIGGSPGAGGAGIAGSSVATSSVLPPAAVAGSATSGPATFQTVRFEAGQTATPSNVISTTPMVAQGQLLFPTATVVAAEMGQNVLVDTNSAAPAGAVSATARTTNAIAPAAPSSAAVVDRIFSNESTLLTSEGDLSDSAPVAAFEDNGPVDLAVAAGLALAVSGSWGGMEPWDAERKQVSVTR